MRSLFGLRRDYNEDEMRGEDGDCIVINSLTTPKGDKGDKASFSFPILTFDLYDEFHRFHLALVDTSLLTISPRILLQGRAEK